MDDSRGRALWTLFNPTALLKILHPVFLPLRHAVYLLPMIVLVSLYVLSGNHRLVLEDLSQLASVKTFVLNALSGDSDSIIENLGQLKMLMYLLIGAVVVNLLVTLVTAMVAYSFRATVTGWCLRFGGLLGSTVRIGEVRKFSRRERIWLHGAPLLMRMGLFGAGVLLWFYARSAGGIWPSFGLALAVMSAVSFFVSANPLVKSSIYHLISAYLEEPSIRERSSQVLKGKFRGGTYTKVDGDVLTAYTLAVTTYTLVLIEALLFLVDRVFNTHIGDFLSFPLLIITAVAAWRMIRKFRELGKAHERKAQFERWRKSDLPKGEIESDEKARLSPLTSYFLRATGLMILVILFFPHGYEIGGRFVVLPQARQDVTSEVSGIIESINFDGGEFLTRGTVIGRLSSTDYIAQAKILAAKIAEQEAVIAELKSRPRPEEVAVAQRNLQTEETRAQFSKEELARMEKLYAAKTVSFEDVEDARRERELDVRRVEEKRAALELIRSGVPPDQISAAEAKLRSWDEERQLYLEKIEKSVFYAPIDGTLVAMHLKQRVGSYFERGQPLAVVENTKQVFVQIDVAEQDIGFVREDAMVRVRFPTYSGDDIEGRVLSIGPTVTEGRAGRVLQITAQFDNEDGKMKSGMEGYAKIRSGSMPVWKVFSLRIIRFFNVEAWSWLP